MKTRTVICRCCLGAMLILGTVLNLNADVTVGVDPGAAWIGFMNVSDLPADGGAYQFGQAWGTADLNATFSGAVLALTPNTSISRDVALSDTFWWKADTSGNKNMDANMYVQDDSLAGQTVTFSGLVLDNTLMSPYSSTVFIKDFVADYSSFTSSTTPVAAGVFNISLATAAGHHIQYGFETVGPNARLDEVAGLGSAQITAIPEPATAAIMFGGILCFLFVWRSKSTLRPE